MSVVQNPLIGRARQKLGGTVFTTWKGINVIKGKPLTVANPKTDGQLMRRSALTQIVEIGRKIAGAINFGFKEQAVRKSAFNAFVGYCLKNAFNYSSPPTATVVPADILVSQGTISATPIAALTAVSGTDIAKFTWSAANLAPGQSNADEALCALFNQTTGEWLAPQSVAATRLDEEASFNCPDGFFSAGNTVRGYLFFYNATNRKSSDSVNTTAVAS